MVVHDPNLAAKYTDRRIMMKEGKIFGTEPPNAF
jgi:ABC-type hemin transport system ATPase subunit